MQPTFHLGSFELRAWAVCVTAGVLLCWVLLIRRCARLGYPPRLVFLWVLLAFPVGALAAYAIAFAVARALGQPGSLLGAGSSGMTVVGSLVGCFGFSVIYIRVVFGEPAGRLLDAVAFTYPLSIAFGRLGCLLNGCCFGKPAGAPHLFTVAAGRFAAGTPAGERYAAADPSLPVWNFPLLLILGALAGVVFTEWLYARRDRFAAGAVLAGAILFDSLIRLAAEWTRDEPPLPGLPFNAWQALVLVVALIAAAALAVRTRSIWARGRST